MKKIFLFLTLLAITQFVYAQTADEIVNKYLQAIGGADKWKKLESQTTTGFVVLQGMEIPYMAVQARPNLSYSMGEFQGNKFIDAFDGTVAWTQNPMSGTTKPMKKDTAETKEVAKENFEDDLIDYSDKGHKLEIAAQKEIIEGVKCFKITMKRKQGDEKIYFFDDENYLSFCVRSYPQTGPMKGQDVETYFSDYREVDGMMIPFTIESKVGHQTQVTIKMDKIEFNKEVDKSIFTLPEK